MPPIFKENLTLELQYVGPHSTCNAPKSDKAALSFKATLKQNFKFSHYAALFVNFSAS